MKNLLKKVMAKKTNKKGFTLVELIVVIAIIGVLAAILIPSMIGFLGDSKESTDSANAKAIYNASAAALTKCVADDRTIVTPTATGDAVSSGTFVFSSSVASPALPAIQLSDYQKNIDTTATIVIFYTSAGDVTKVTYQSANSSTAQTYPKP